MTAPNHNLIVEKTNFTIYRKARDPELCETALMTTTSPTEKNGNELSLWPHWVWSESSDFIILKWRPWRPIWERSLDLDLHKNKNRQHLSQSCLESSRQSHGVENLALHTAVAWASPAGHSHMNWVSCQSLFNEAKPPSSSLLKWEGRIFTWAEVLSDICVRASPKTPSTR